MQYLQLILIKQNNTQKRFLRTKTVLCCTCRKKVPIIFQLFCTSYIEIRLYTLFAIRIYFIRVTKLNLVKFLERYFENKPDAEIWKRMLFCVLSKHNNFFIFQKKAAKLVNKTIKACTSQILNANESSMNDTCSTYMFSVQHKT